MHLFDEVPRSNVQNVLVSGAKIGSWADFFIGNFEASGGHFDETDEQRADARRG